MHSNNSNIKLTPHNNANEIVDEPSKSIFSRHQDNLEISMRESDFIPNSVQLIYHKYHKVNFIRARLCINSLGWIKKKKRNNKSKK